MVKRIHNLPDEHHFALALLATNAAQLDVHITVLIATLLEREVKTAKFLLSNLSSDRLVGLLNALLDDTFPREKNRVRVLIAQIRQLRNERNRMVHDIWQMSEDGLIFHTPIHPFRERNRQIKSAKDVERIAERFFDCSVELAAFQIKWIETTEQARQTKKSFELLSKNHRKHPSSIK